MIFFTKIENNDLIIKVIENNNVYSVSIKNKIKKDTLHTFRDFYHNIHKNTPSIITLDNLILEYKDNIIKFENNNIQFKISKSNEIIDMFDKVITNLMIYDMEHESPKKDSDDSF